MINKMVNGAKPANPDRLWVNDGWSSGCEAGLGTTTCLGVIRSSVVKRMDCLGHLHQLAG